MERFITTIAVFVISFSALADYKEFYYKRLLNNNLQENKSIQIPVVTNWMDQRLDHFDKNNQQTFKQRYYINTSYAMSSASPVLLYICGESTCHASSVGRGAIVDYAKRFNAVIVALEHRYYGQSQPFDKLTTKNMKYLSTYQAVEDLASFQKYLSQKNSFNGKWVAIGGSYPGNLAAYYRLKYPDLVVGALASSAPVKAKAEFNEYDAHVTKVVGTRCAGLMRKAVAEIEASLKHPSRLKKIKALFNSQVVKNPVDFLYVVADIGAIAAQYGYVKNLCSHLEKGKTPLEGYASFGRYILGAWGLTAEQISIGSATSTDPNDYINGFGMRQWLYQSCTEYGYWQVADSKNSTRSSLIDLDYHNDICNRLFGLTKPVDTRHINNNFYLPLLDASKVSNILFTNGSTDPWMNLSILPSGGVNSSNDYYLIEGAAHCDDLRSMNMRDSTELKEARFKFRDLLETWL